jgi:SNF2 family DNA or RNA helicase
MEYLIEPWAHQKEAIRRAETLQNFALFFEMGTGKTGTTINIIRSKCNQARRMMRTLILCPPIVVKNWRKEFELHSKVRPDQILLLTGSGKYRLKRFRASVEEGSKPGHGLVVVTNYETLLMSEVFSAILTWQPEILVCDESHKCKDSKAKRTKLAIELSRVAKHRYLLTGTPVLNSPMDLFSQFLILDQGETFGKNFFMFRARYFRDKNSGMPRDRYFPDWQIRPGALEEINHAISASGMRVTKDECLDLPPLVRQTILVGMTPDQARMYREMKKDFIAFMNDKAVTATLAMTKALRLMQIASGYVKTVEGEEIALEDTPKMVALSELLSEITPSHKVLVWACWRKNYAEIRRVCDRLGLDTVEIHGDVNISTRDEAVERFNSDPRCRVFIGHPGAAGIGINLVAASYSIFYSRNFSLEQDLQAEARCYRSGSERHAKITRIDLACEGTIDEIVAKKLADKQQIGESVLRDLSLELTKTETTQE